MPTLRCENPRTAEINELLEKARDLFKDLSPDAISTASRALWLAEEADDVSLQAKVLHWRGIAQGKLGNIDAAVVDLEQSLERAERCGDRLRIADCLHGLSTAKGMYGDVLGALELMSESLAIRRSLGNKSQYILPLSNLAANCIDLGDFQQATIYLLEALEIAEELHDCENQMYCLTNFGVVKQKCKDFEEALHFFNQSLNISEQLNEFFVASGTLVNKAVVLCELGRYEEAQLAAEECVVRSRKTNNAYRETSALLCLGMILAQRQHVEAALELLLQAAMQADRLDYGHIQAEIHCALGRCYLQKNDLPEARSYLERALSEARDSNGRTKLCEILQAMVELFEAEGDYHTALHYHRAYHDTWEALRLDTAHRLLIAQKARLSLRKAEEEAAATRRENEILTKLIAQKAAELQAAEERASLLTKQALTDALTGLLNRRYLSEYLPTALHEALESQLPLTLVIADLDNFKLINDRFSHRIGDIVLKTTAQILMNNSRRHDRIIRYGGEEFVVVLPETDIMDAVTICERLRLAIETYNWKSVHPALTVTTSMGAVLATHTEAEVLLAEADKHLYTAKRNGKNQVVFR